MIDQWSRLILLLAVTLLACRCSEDGAAPPTPTAGAAGAPQPPTAGPQSKAPDRAALPTVHLSPAFPKLIFQRPVFLTHAGDGTNRVFVVEQPGRILVFENKPDIETPAVFLDIRSSVRTEHNEEGLLSLAFHLRFAENGMFYVYYSVSDPKRNRIARFAVMKDDPSRADPASERIILEVEQPYGNHNGSTLLFGPDGYLYASFGDGGAAGDPHGNGQKLSTLLGSIIRIDIDHQDDGRQYAIPKENPFIDRAAGNARPEIWAYGLRNVWRMSFDRQTGVLWAGDVGQDAWEEIDIITKGGNYGWSLREGLHQFAPGVRRMGDRQPVDPLIDPVIDYPHREGISVTGGCVYRGQANRRLQGVYIYADYATRAIWGLRHEDGKVVASRKMAGGAESAFISSFGEDAAGELYACAFDQLDGRRGRIFKVVENP